MPRTTEQVLTQDERDLILAEVRKNRLPSAERGKPLPKDIRT